MIRGRIKVDKCACWAYAILSFLTLLSFSNTIKLDDKIDLLIRVCCYSILMSVPLLVGRVRKRTMAVCMLFAALSIYSYIATHSFLVMTSTMAIMASGFLNNKRIVKWIMIGTISALIAHLCATVVSGSILDYIPYRGKQRFLLGFESPNTMGIYSLWINLMAYRVSNKKLPLVIIGALSLLVYLLTDCRSLAVCEVVFLLLVGVSRKRFAAEIVRRIAVFIFPILAMIIFCLVCNLHFGCIQKIDALMTHRLSWGAMAIEENGYSFFPQKTQYDMAVKKTSDYYTVDIGYIVLMHKYGFIYIIAISALLAVGAKMGDRKKAITIIVFAVSLVFETHGLNALIGFPLLNGSNNEGEE